MDGIAQFSTVGQTVHLPPALMQPIAADDVATALSEVALGAPVNGLIELAGPERAGLDELVGRFLAATKDPREVITDVDARYYGLVVNDQSLTPGANPRIGATSFEDWLNRYITSLSAISLTLTDSGMPGKFRDAFAERGIGFKCP